MKRRDMLSWILFAILLFAVFTFFWNYRTTVPWLWEKVASGLLPLLGGFGIGFALNILSSFIENRILRTRKTSRSADKLTRIVSILLALLLLMAFAAFIITLVLPELIDAVSIFISSLRSFASDSGFWDSLDIRSIPVIGTFFDSADDTILTAADALEEKLNEWTPSILSFTIATLRNFIGGAATFAVSVIFAVYFVANKEMLRRHITKLLTLIVKDRTLKKLEHTASLGYTAFSRFIIAQVTEAVIIGCLCFTGMLLFRFPYAPVVAALTGVMALIPVYGAVIGALIGAFMIAVVSPWQGLFFLIFIVVLQQLEGDLIYPRVVGSSIGVPSVYVFASVTLGGALFGILGMLLAVPLFSVVFTLLKEHYAERMAGKSDDISLNRETDHQ